jgi:hypothetical protein
MAKLYELSEQYRKFNELVDNGLSNDELTEDDLQMYIDTLDSIKDAIDGKCENIAKFLRNIEGDIDAYKSEEKRLAKKRKYLENKYDGLKGYMEQMLINANIKQVKAGNFNIRFQKSPSSVEVVDEASIPNEYKEPQPAKIVKKAILDDLKKGKVISGVLLVDDKEHLRIS